MLAKIRIYYDGEVRFFDESNIWHRLGGGPAIESPDGSKEWFVNGKRHRLDGPAIECTYGFKEWFINDKEYSEEEFKKIVGEIC